MAYVCYYLFEYRERIVRYFTYSILKVLGFLKVVEAYSILLFILDELPKRNAAVVLPLRTVEVILNRLTPRLTRLVVLLGL